MLVRSWIEAESGRCSSTYGKMESMSPRWTVNRVGLWSPCGLGNMGNEMTMSAMIQNLRRLHPDIVLCGFSWNPQDTFERHGIPSFPIKRGGRASKGSHGPSEAKDSGTSNWKTRLQRYRNLSRAAKYISAPLLESAFLNRIRGYLRGLDLLVFAGTGPFTDSWGGVMGFPYSISQWIHLCRVSGTKVAVVSAGAGPLDSWASKRLIRSAL